MIAHQPLFIYEKMLTMLLVMFGKMLYSTGQRSVAYVHVAGKMKFRLK